MEKEMSLLEALNRFEVLRRLADRGRFNLIHLPPTLVDEVVDPESDFRSLVQYTIRLRKEQEYVREGSKFPRAWGRTRTWLPVVDVANLEVTVNIHGEGVKYFIEGHNGQFAVRCSQMPKPLFSEGVHQAALAVLTGLGRALGDQPVSKSGAYRPEEVLLYLVEHGGARYSDAAAWTSEYSPATWAWNGPESE